MHTPQGMTRPFGIRSLLAMGLSLAAIAALATLLVARVRHANAVVQDRPGQATVTSGVGLPAPQFTVTEWQPGGRTGETLRLADLRGHPVVVNFWASWCDACSNEAPLLEAAWHTYQPRGVKFVGIAVHDEQRAGTAFLRQHHISYPCGSAKSSAPIDVAYGLPGLPVTVFIDRNGIVVSRFTGAITRSGLDHGVRLALGASGP